jgi:two-component system KDP operon response regulator KdpE
VTHFLVVDDDLDAQIIVSAYLSALGTVTVAGSAAEAVAAAAATAPELAIIDIGLPDRDGIELLAELRAIAALGAMRAIAVSAHGDLDIRARIVAAPFDDFLWKPIDGQDLLRVVRRSLGEAGP